MSLELFPSPDLPFASSSMVGENPPHAAKNSLIQIADQLTTDFQLASTCGCSALPQTQAPFVLAAFLASTQPAPLPTCLYVSFELPRPGTQSLCRVIGCLPSATARMSSRPGCLPLINSIDTAKLPRASMRAPSSLTQRDESSALRAPQLSRRLLLPCTSTDQIRTTPVVAQQ